MNQHDPELFNGTGRPPESGENPVDMTDSAAWEWLQREIGKSGGRLSTTVRALAAEWRWAKSRVERFLSRLRTETRIETETRDGRTSITIRASQEKPMPADSKTGEAVERLLAAAAPKPDPDEKFWDEAKEDGIIIQERADRVAVYRTACDQVAIRGEASGYDDGDPCIIVEPKNLGALIDRLTELRDELSRDS